MTESVSQDTQPQTPSVVDISSPELSFAEYQNARRNGNVVEPKAAPESEVTPEQKTAKASDALETDAIDANDEDDSSELDSDKPKKQGGFQKKINKLTARVSAAQAEIDHWKEQALKGASEQPKQSTQVESKSAEGKPIPDNFESHADYIEALTDWKVDQKHNAITQEEQKSKILTERQELEKAYLARRKSFEEKTEDFAEVLSEVDEIPVSATVHHIILTSDNGPEIAYEMAKNKAEFARICALHPIAAAREIGKIESRLVSKVSEPKETKKITTAPKPLEPVGKGTTGSLRLSINDPDIPFSEYERLRREQIRKRR